MNVCDQIVKVHIGASIGRLLESAEQMELKKVYQDGTLRELCVEDITNYKDSGTMHSRTRLLWCSVNWVAGLAQ